MSRVAYRMVLTPPTFWSDGLGETGMTAGFVRDALAIERRLPKGVNLESERSRYFLCCRRIQEAARESEGYASAVMLGEGYLHVLRALGPRPGTRIGACFYPPDTIKGQIQAFTGATAAARLSDHPSVRARLDVLQAAEANRNGVVEILELLPSGGGVTERIVVPAVQTAAARQGEFADELTEVSRGKFVDVFLRTVLDAIKRGMPADFSNQPHSVITEVLHRITYRTAPAQIAGHVRVVYMDGSEAEPFPVGCLDAPDLADSGGPWAVLKASLVSMRHLEMDEQADIAWFRNRRVSMPRPFAETDAYCTEETARLLEGLTTSAPLRLELHQTGLETAVVGFYRGLVKVLRQWRRVPQAPRILVVPRFFNKGSAQYEDGPVWS